MNLDAHTWASRLCVTGMHRTRQVSQDVGSTRMAHTHGNGRACQTR